MTSLSSYQKLLRQQKNTVFHVRVRAFINSIPCRRWQCFRRSGRRCGVTIVLLITIMSAEKKTIFHVRVRVFIISIPCRWQCFSRGRRGCDVTIVKLAVVTTVAALVLLCLLNLFGWNQNFICIHRYHAWTVNAFIVIISWL